MMKSEDGAMREMPKYRCHKMVWALRIADIFVGEGGATIVPADRGYSSFDVDSGYMNKHKPEVGGYHVVYEDGYKSYSPAEAFEAGYLPLSVADKSPTPSEALFGFVAWLTTRAETITAGGNENCSPWAEAVPKRLTRSKGCSAHLGVALPN